MLFILKLKFLKLKKCKEKVRLKFGFADRKKIPWWNKNKSINAFLVADIRSVPIYGFATIKKDKKKIKQEHKIKLVYHLEKTYCLKILNKTHWRIVGFLITYFINL